MTTHNLYLVADGVATITDGRAETDGFDSVLAWARDEAQALGLASEYDAGGSQPDNLTLPDGRTVAALQPTD